MGTWVRIALEPLPFEDGKWSYCNSVIEQLADDPLDSRWMWPMNGILNSGDTHWRMAALLSMATLCSSGCPSVRVVSKQESGGVIAIPANTDIWPFRYRSKAEAMIAQQCPKGYVIELEEEYVTGQQTHVEEEHRDNTQQLSKRASLSVETSNSTATTSDVKEWRIHYRKKTADEDSRPDREVAELSRDEAAETDEE